MLSGRGSPRVRIRESRRRVERSGGGVPSHGGSRQVTPPRRRPDPPGRAKTVLHTQTPEPVTNAAHEARSGPTVVSVRRLEAPTPSAV